MVLYVSCFGADWVGCGKCSWLAETVCTAASIVVHTAQAVTKPVSGLGGGDRAGTAWADTPFA